MLNYIQKMIGFLDRLLPRAPVSLCLLQRNYGHLGLSWVLVFVCFFLTAFSFWGCSIGSVGPRAGSKYKYWYGLTKPIVSNRLRFEDNRIFIQFRIDESFVNFRLQNVSTEPLSILWDRVTLVVAGKVSSIKYSANAYTNEPIEKVPTEVPSYGYLIDFLVPAEKVLRTKEKWVELDLFPTRDYGREQLRTRILQNVRKPVTMYFPLAVGEEVIEYVFEFKVAEVGKLDWSKYRPPRRRYKPTPSVIGIKDDFTTAIVISLFVVAGVYFLFIRKPTPEE